MEQSFHIRIHPHKIIAESNCVKSKIGKSWECAGSKIDSQINPKGCKSQTKGESKISNPSIVQFTCEEKCAGFSICGSCALQLSDAAVLPQSVDRHPLHNQHPLIRTFNQNSNWRCDASNFLGCLSEFGDSDIQKSAIIMKGIDRFNCKACNFDLCLKCLCYYADHPEISDLYKINSKFHEHPLNRYFDDNGWRCDGSSSSPSGCFSGIKGFNQTTGFNRWRCNKCDFDLCQKCLQASITDACPFTEPLTRKQFEEQVSKLK